MSRGFSSVDKVFDGHCSEVASFTQTNPSISLASTTQSPALWQSVREAVQNGQHAGVVSGRARGLLIDAQASWGHGVTVEEIPLSPDDPSSTTNPDGYEPLAPPKNLLAPPLKPPRVILHLGLNRPQLVLEKMFGADDVGHGGTPSESGRFS